MPAETAKFNSANSQHRTFSVHFHYFSLVLNWQSQRTSAVLLLLGWSYLSYILENRLILMCVEGFREDQYYVLVFRVVRKAEVSKG